MSYITKNEETFGYNLILETLSNYISESENINKKEVKEKIKEESKKYTKIYSTINKDKLGLAAFPKSAKQVTSEQLKASLISDKKIRRVYNTYELDTKKATSQDVDRALEIIKTHIKDQAITKDSSLSEVKMKLPKTIKDVWIEIEKEGVFASLGNAIIAILLISSLVGSTLLSMLIPYSGLVFLPLWYFSLKYIYGLKVSNFNISLSVFVAVVMLIVGVSLIAGPVPFISAMGPAVEAGIALAASAPLMLLTLIFAIILNKYLQLRAEYEDKNGVKYGIGKLIRAIFISIGLIFAIVANVLIGFDSQNASA
jgi:hypothetical protein